MQRVFLCLLASLVAARTVRADEWWAVHSSPDGRSPRYVTKMPDAMPEPEVLPVGMYDPHHPFGQPVARVDGVDVPRPLFPSIVADPADRALILRDYRRNHFMLQPFQLGDAVKRQQHVQFHDIDALRDLRLQKEHATLEDYRRYVADEIRLAAMLYLNGHNARTATEQSALLRDYVLALRRKAVIEKLPG